MYIRELEVTYSKKINIPENFQKEDFRVVGPKSIQKLFNKIVKQNTKENLLLFCLDQHNQVTYYNIISIGSNNISLAHPREIFQPAILSNSNRIVLAHNHPTGNLEPSSADIDITKRVQELGEIFGIELLDSIVVSTEDDRYYSMYENGKI